MCGGVWLRTCVIADVGDGACISTCRALSSSTGSCQQNSPASKALRLHPKSHVSSQLRARASVKPRVQDLLVSLVEGFAIFGSQVPVVIVQCLFPVYVFVFSYRTCSCCLAHCSHQLAGRPCSGIQVSSVCRENSFVFLPNGKHGGNKGRKLYT